MEAMTDMHTESEAKTKWCPFARVLHSYTSSYGGLGYAAGVKRIDESQHRGSKCLGSACMAWRWSSAKGLTYRPQESLSGIGTAFGTSWAEPQRPAFINAEWKWDSTRGVWHTGAPTDAVGFCGLSGSTTP